MTTGIGTDEPFVLAEGTKVLVTAVRDLFVAGTPKVTGTIQGWTRELADDEIGDEVADSSEGQFYFDDDFTQIVMGGSLYIIHIDPDADGNFPQCNECEEDHRQIGLTTDEFEVVV